MKYLLPTEFTTAIKAAGNNFKELKNLRPVLDPEGEPVSVRGDFSVVYKMKDELSGKLHAVKCFLKEQDGRAEAYQLIVKELERVNSSFLTPCKYFCKELFVYSNYSEETLFPVLLMDWVEGKTLNQYISEHFRDQNAVSLLAYQFSRLAIWLMSQPFAHGDLNLDNILVREDGSLVLVDYDGMFVPSMKGQKARELGSPDFQNPSRTKIDFNEHIDDFPLISILLSIKAISLQPELLKLYGESDRLLFSSNDYQNHSESIAINALKPLLKDKELSDIHALFLFLFYENELPQESISFLLLHNPQEEEHENKNNDNNETSITHTWLEEQDYSYYSGKNYEEQLQSFYWKTKRTIILDRDGHKCKMCGTHGNSNNPIEVHHRYYIFNNLAWQYDNSVLISLCHDCHQLVHKSISPLCYYTDGNQLLPMKFTPCSRCNGRGYFPEYKNIQGGICFRCQGQRYEELIDNNKTIKIIDLLSSNEECFDAIHPIQNQKQLSDNFTHDKNYHYEINGMKFNLKEEKKYYRLAAINGFGKAQNNYGLILKKNGDYGAALRWFVYAAMKGIYQAQINLKDLFENGLGVKKNKEIANHWYLLSMMNSNDGDMFGNVLDLVKIADSKSYDALKHIFGEAITIPNEIISTKATDEDLANVWVDENGVKYSADLCKLLDVPNYIENYTIKTGTKIICDNAFRLDGIFGLFNRTDGIKEIKIPNTVTHIGNYSFSGNEVLERVYMGDMVISIGDYAFAECKELTHFTIPNKTLKIGKNPFMGCEKMSEITCNSNFFKYHNSALYTRDMKTLIACLYKGAIYNIPNTVTIIGESAFGGLSIIKVDIPPTVSEIEENAFRGCRSLAYINLPNSIKIIHNNVFRGTSLQKIVLPESVCRIEEEAFAYCSLLNNIILPSSLKYIGKSAFERCKSLQSIVIPNSVESIEDYAFFCCEQLSDIIIPNSVIKVGKGVFTECKALKRCFLSSNIKEIGENVFSGCSNLFQIVVPIGSKRMFEKLLPDYHNIIIDTNELEEYFEEVTDENSGGPWIDDYSSKKGFVKDKNIDDLPF